MLSPRDDDDDDSHLCIKCNATIIGLNNYVKHRKQKCSKKTETSKPEISPIDHLEPTYNLGADVFFQSLELQSSGKKPESSKPDITNIEPLEPSYNLGADVFFQSLELQSSGKKPEISKPDLPTTELLETTYNLGADVFFQSLELQQSVKKSLTRLSIPLTVPKVNIDKKTLLPVASTSREIPRISLLDANLRGEDWIGGHSLKIASNDDNQTKLINAVAIISGAVKKDIPKSTYNITYNDYKPDDESEESSDSDDDDDDIIHETGNKWKPPSNYTGGKWRPMSPDHEDWDTRDEQEHTGGKWKPVLLDTNDHDDDYDAPPPDHTRGKWVPGADKTQIMQTTIHNKGAILYWCGACNRRLGSKTIYEKHLMSNLHMKNVLPERELEYSGPLEPLTNTPDKRVTRPSRMFSSSIYAQNQNTVLKPLDIPSTSTAAIKKKKRNRRRQFIYCSGCKSRVRSHLMGKHLISHYHFRKVRDKKCPEYQQFILDNILKISHESPFQCSPCKFYTNWLPNFIQHWKSEEHITYVTSIEGRFWCSFCKFECDTSDEMLKHLSGADHRAVVEVINRSMPIIIRKKTVITCGTCSKEFRYNIDARKHCQITGHRLPHSATENHQESCKCKSCNMSFKSSLAVAAHLKTRHEQRVYHCLVCSKTFATADEAKRHRQTSEHRIGRKEKLRAKGVKVKDMSKKCPHCIEKVILNNVVELKEHMRTVHPEIKKKCPKCGMSFILSQEVSLHIRNNACQFQDLPLTLTSSIIWSCNQCLFTTDSQAECFFHEVLHSDPLEEIKIIGAKRKITVKYDCPLCPKAFRKASLRHHLKQHTFERPFVCSICGANYTRQSSLSAHLKNEHGSARAKTPGLVAIEEHLDFGRFPENVDEQGPTCEKTTTEKLTVRQRKKQSDGAIRHECQLCGFKTDQSSHLKRHLLCHQGVKPYACPHCEFTCGSLENLRKHVLRGGRHQGLFLYKCSLCDYVTNMATQFRVHLCFAHNYDAKKAVHETKLHLMVKKTGSEVNTSNI